MENKVSALPEWAVEVDLKALMDYTDCKGTCFDVQGIYVSDAALAAHISCKGEGSLSDSDRQGLGRLLRFLAGIAEEVGFTVPVLGVLDVSKDGKAVDESLVKQWASDQDWHRGDFSIMAVDGDESPETLIRKMLGSVSTAWPPVELRPRDLDAILSAFESERRARRVSADYESLLDAINVALREGTGNAIEKWLNDRLYDVRQLMTGREDHA